METTAYILPSLAPLPDSELAISEAIELKNYQSLYQHYAFGKHLPFDFPMKIKQAFPSEVYKNLLKKQIDELYCIVKSNLNTHYAYIQEYNKLFMHYACDLKVPSDISSCTLEKFPDKRWKNALRSEIILLQGMINIEKEVI